MPGTKGWVVQDKVIDFEDEVYTFFDFKTKSLTTFIFNWIRIFQINTGVWFRNNDSLHGSFD